MGPESIWRRLRRALKREHRGVLAFDQRLREAGGIVARVDRGMQTVATDQIVGSLSRWQNLRSDFLYRTGRAMTERFVRIGAAMAAGKQLPPIDLYKLSQRAGTAQPQRSEYFVVDGHHRVAMARRLGQAFLDAHVVEYLVDDATSECEERARAAPRPLASPRARRRPGRVVAPAREQRVTAGQVVCRDSS